MASSFRFRRNRYFYSLMRKILTTEFIPHFAIRIACAFIFFTVIGTLTHELGHIAVAKYFGYETTLHYGYMKYDYPGYQEDPLYLEFRVIFDEHKEDLANNISFPAKTRYLELIDQLKAKYPRPKPHAFWVTLGGPIQTILTSIIGLMILYYRKSRKKDFFVLLDWLGVFLALFILREVFNWVFAMMKYLLYEKTNFNGDEFRLSQMLDLNEWVVPTMTLVPALLISLYIIFKVIPLKYRFSFIIAGLVGGILGFFIWLDWLGPQLMP